MDENLITLLQAVYELGYNRGKGRVDSEGAAAEFEPVLESLRPQLQGAKLVRVR